MSKKKLKTNSATIIQRYEAIQKVGTEVEVPWHVYRFLGDRRIDIFGNLIAIGAENDYGSLTEVRAALEWYVTQLGGTVKWG